MTKLSSLVALLVAACVLIVPGTADCQFPAYLWQSWSSRFQYEAKRWTSRTLYPAGSSVNWTSRQDIDVMPSQLTVKAVTKAVCFDSNTNTSVVCDRKDILYHVDCLTVGHSDVYRVYIHGGGQVNIVYISDSFGRWQTVNRNWQMLMFEIRISPYSVSDTEITACAVATSCCRSYVPCQGEGQNFDPPQLPDFPTDLSGTQNEERYPGYDHACKIWLTWGDGIYYYYYYY